MKLFIIFSILLIITQLKSEEDLTIKQINSFGFKGEIHKVETADNYLLTLHRIKPRKFTNSSQVVLLVHGICCTSSEFLSSKRTSLAIFLFENGFDVFLGNVRGNKYSKSHKNLNHENKEFWNFSLHELGIFDLAAFIDFILKFTKNKKLFYIGHSQGATIPLILLSSKPEYNEKIYQLHLSAPAPFMSHFPNVLIKKYGKQAVKTFTKNNLINLTPIIEVLHQNLYKHCSLNQPLYFITCMIVEFLILGDNFTKLEADHETFDKLLTFLSPNVSSTQVLHFFQFIESGKFRQFDYGRKKNLEKYGMIEPPEYDLKKVVTPTYIYCAERDRVVARKDIEHLREILPNVITYKLLKNYNHIDFDIGINARKDVHKDILKAMKMNSKRQS
ncbi:hypothetical protein PVAND_016639 [Polypedilum vanderplanki]|uniref:Lipase n=1 Tax=Polypedilum vanderplanki TaxID=319348 RepID=A0A9J6BGW8_POLVA|nr:hypothetical protein PVAND_016639 [Polypedilum vanderplanki]